MYRETALWDSLTLSLLTLAALTLSLSFSVIAITLSLLSSVNAQSLFPSHGSLSLIALSITLFTAK